MPEVYRHIISKVIFHFIGTIYIHCLHSRKPIKLIQHLLFLRGLLVEVHLRRFVMFLCLYVNGFLLCH